MTSITFYSCVTIERKFTVHSTRNTLLLLEQRLEPANSMLLLLQQRNCLSENFRALMA